MEAEKLQLWPNILGAIRNLDGVHHKKHLEYGKHMPFSIILIYQIYQLIKSLLRIRVFDHFFSKELESQKTILWDWFLFYLAEKDKIERRSPYKIIAGQSKSAAVKTAALFLLGEKDI